jgi:prophage regulatory protein
MAHEPLHSGFMRESEVVAELPFSRITLYREIRFGRFPRPVKLSAGTRVWFRDDIVEWFEKHRRDAAPRVGPYVPSPRR